MLQGIYTAAAGMLANDAISEVIANNLANASTPGFRQDFATFHMAAEERYGNRTVLVPPSGVAVVHSVSAGRL
ncbi:MAG: hypothetical protein KatS3mg115_2290 [Candidatus Poribacteria bacterium]|nr:MAG: hypothetical protein KatS3mg115_2290 [Candidatus Poribacteria bacterium]